MPPLAALCMPLPSALQLSVLPLSLLLESSLRLLFTTAPTVCLCFGSVYFNLLGSNNISRPGVRKARKKVNGKIAGCCYRKTTDRFRKKIRCFFFLILCFVFGYCLLFCMHADTGGERVLLFCSQHRGLLHTCRHNLSPSHAHTNMYACTQLLWLVRV